MNEWFLPLQKSNLYTFIHFSILKALTIASQARSAGLSNETTRELFNDKSTNESPYNTIQIFFKNIGYRICCPLAKKWTRCLGRATKLFGDAAVACNPDSSCPMGYQCSNFTSTLEHVCCEEASRRTLICPQNRSLILLHYSFIYSFHGGLILHSGGSGLTQGQVLVCFQLREISLTIKSLILVIAEPVRDQRC